MLIIHFLHKVFNRATPTLSQTILCLLLLLFISSSTFASGKPTKKNESILLISSYNPDTKRISDFIRDLEQNIEKKHYSYNIVVEDMGCRGLSDIKQWDNTFSSILKKYSNTQLRGIVLIGQEAWGTYINHTGKLPDVPFFGCYAGIGGITMPNDSTNLAQWEPQYVNTADIANKKGKAGGYLTLYDVEANIKLIESLHGKIKHLAFLSDNSYGGLCAQAHMKEEINKKFPDIKLILLDGRRKSVYSIIDEIGILPLNSILLLGTWRIDKDGNYFLQSSISNLIVKNPNIPVYTFSGRGLGSIAIGGNIPEYMADAASVLEQIHGIQHRSIKTPWFDVPQNKFVFDRLKLNQFGIKDYQLPSDSTFENELENRIRQYQSYIYLGIGTLACLTSFVLILIYLNVRNKRLRDSLIKNEHELILAKEKAEDADKMKTAFLANMSHEIRTPLNAIVGFSQFMADPSFTDEEKIEFSQLIARNSDMLLTLINDILDISRLETNKIIFDFKDENINNVCQYAMSSIHHLRKPDIAYDFTCNNDDFIMETDALRLSQVLINLLTNANKFTETGTITLDCLIEKKSNKVTFSVTDTGCGVPLEQQKKIFDRFEKLNEYKQGSGLGLAICKQITRHLEGEIFLDSSHTKGARFVLVIPIQR